MRANLIFRLSGFLIFLFFTATLSFAQKSISLKIDYLTPQGGFSANQKASIEQMTDMFIAKGCKITDHPDWRILISIHHLDKPGAGKVIISYTL